VGFSWLLLLAITHFYATPGVYKTIRDGRQSNAARGDAKMVRTPVPPNLLCLSLALMLIRVRQRYLADRETIYLAGALTSDVYF